LGDEFLRDLVVLFHSDNQEAFRKLSLKYEVDCLLPDGESENGYSEVTANERDRYNLYLVKQSSDGKNILHLAALYQQRWLVKYIIDALPMIYFKLINDEDNDGLIPVDVACLTGNRDIAWDIATQQSIQLGFIGDTSSKMYKEIVITIFFMSKFKLINKLIN
jgi:hypothetical protein